MARILAVGVATLDIINEVSAYPREDAELRALAHTVRRGGNATNTLVVLSQLGHSCDWAGVLVDRPDAAIINSELAEYGIGTGYCMLQAEGDLPTSCITLSRETGSRTIIHYRDLPEYAGAAFDRIPLADFDWVHFEGRNIVETAGMLKRLRKESPDLKVSLEVEKPRSGIERLFPFADLIQVSPAYAAHIGLPPVDLLKHIRDSAPRAGIVCTLGSKGAIGLSTDDDEIQVDACLPAKVVDTLGAGDTFNAGLIDASLRGKVLSEAMQFATALAGSKCGQTGLHGLHIPDRSGD